MMERGLTLDLKALKARLCIGISQEVRHLIHRGERALHGLFLVRVDQTAGGRGEHAAGDHQVPVDPPGPEDLPDVFQAPDQGGDLLLGKGLGTRGHHAPDDDASPVNDPQRERKYTPPIGS
jgi:hypothetical protein